MAKDYITDYNKKHQFICNYNVKLVSLAGTIFGTSYHAANLTLPIGRLALHVL